MLMFADPVGGSKKGQKHADVILNWSPINNYDGTPLKSPNKTKITYLKNSKMSKWLIFFAAKRYNTLLV